MTEDESLSYISGAPTELLIYIFQFVRPVQLVKCRQVCMRWKLIIDNLLSRDTLWLKFCKQDFKDLYKVAFYKRKPGLRWCDVYRTLSLWPRIGEVTESRDEFASASNSADEVRNFQVLSDGIIGVHSRDAITYYNLDTMEAIKTGSIQGNYICYMENRSAILILEYNLDLFIIRKHAREGQDKGNVISQNVRKCILTTHEVYFVSLNNRVYICRLDKEELNCVQITHMSAGVICIGFSTQLNILTYKQEIYSLIGKEFKLQCTMGPKTNLLHELKKYNLLEHLDCRVYFDWKGILYHSLPQGTLLDIAIIKTYGEAVFIGTNSGVFKIYYAQYINGKFNLFNSKPIKQYDFMEHCNCHDLSNHPILHIDVVEGKDSHSILIAMPKKIAIFTYTHDFNKSKSKLPFSDLSDVVIKDVSN